MDATEQAFLQALATNPDDNTTRFAYADWLQERDRPEWYTVKTLPVRNWITCEADNLFNSLRGLLSIPWLEPVGHVFSKFDEAISIRDAMAKIVAVNTEPTTDNTNG